jgi:hypothetical protein
MMGERECGMDLSGYESGPLEKTIKFWGPQNRKKKIDKLCSR